MNFWNGWRLIHLTRSCPRFSLATPKKQKRNRQSARRNSPHVDTLNGPHRSKAARFHVRKPKTHESEDYSMDRNDRLYTKELDGTIARWYVFALYGPHFVVSPVRNAKLRDYKRYYHMDDVGKTIFSTRKEASNA